MIKKKTPIVVEMSFLDFDGSPLNLTGATVRFMMKANELDGDGAAIVSKQTGSGVVITDAFNGLAEASLSAADLDVAQGKLYCEGAAYTSGACVGRTETVLITIQTNVIKA
jgi:hypothetical protein